MEYQTCPLAVGKSSTTFDEDAELNRTKRRMKEAGKKDNRDTMNVFMDGHADRTAEQIGLHMQLLFSWTNKGLKCNMVTVCPIIIIWNE